MHFWFEFLYIHMNEKTTCHNFHGFKWKNINIYFILIFFLCNLMPFLVHWIAITPIVSKEGKVMDPKKVEALVSMQVLTTLQETHVFNGMA